MCKKISKKLSNLENKLPSLSQAAVTLTDAGQTMELLGKYEVMDPLPYSPIATVIALTLFICRSECSF